MKVTQTYCDFNPNAPLHEATCSVNPNIQTDITGGSKDACWEHAARIMLDMIKAACSVR